MLLLWICPSGSMHRHTPAAGTLQGCMWQPPPTVLLDWQQFAQHWHEHRGSGKEGGDGARIHSQRQCQGGSKTQQ